MTLNELRVELHKDIKLLKSSSIHDMDYELAAFLRDLERRCELGWSYYDILEGHHIDKKKLIKEHKCVKDLFDKYDIKKIRNEKINQLFNS